MALSPRVKHFLRGYYVVNALLLLAYFGLLRPQLVADEGFRDAYGGGGLGGSRESQALFVAAMLTMRKGFELPSVDAVLGTAFFYFKSAIIFVLFICSTQLSLGAAALSLLAFVLFPQPVFEPGRKIAFLNPLSFKDQVTSPDAERKMWVVELFATWSPPCTHVAPVLSKLASEYDPDLAFGKVDVGRFPNVAHEYDVNTDGSSKQIPTLLVFENGVEVARMPPRGARAMPRLTKDSIVESLNLSYWRDRAAKSRAKAASSATAKSKKSKKQD